MPGVIPKHVLVHTATPLSYEEGDPDVPWIEGEPGSGPVPVDGAAFRCVLFLPSPGGEEQNQFRPRVVTVPTLLLNPTRDDSSVIELSDEDELMVDAPEFAPWVGSNPGRWQVVGDAQPFGPPGQVIGVLATLRMVRD